MAVWVLLSVDDEKEAKQLVSSILTHSSVYDYVTEEPVTAKVHGVWKKPAKFCNPLDGHRKKNAGWTRGRLYGWWVCTVCGKPSAAKQTATEWVLALGTNLLPAKFIPHQRRLEGWDSPKEWSFLLGDEKL